MESVSFQKMNRKLKIALATDWYLPRWGGTELGVHKLAKQLQAHGHEVHVVTTIPGPPEVDGVLVHRIPASLFPKYHFAISTKIFPKIREVFERENFDLIHCHGSSVPPVASGCVMLAQKMGIPAVCTIRSLLGSYQFILKITDYFMGWSDWNVVYSGNCEKVASELRDWIEPSKIQVLPNGLDPEEWRVPREAKDKNEIHITSIMRVTRRKRPRDFVRMIAKVKERIPETIRLKVWIVGDGPARKAVYRIAKRLGLEDVVNITGFVGKDEIKKIFSKTDIYVQPTIVEAFGNAALEARASGLPVIARREGGIKEFIADGVEGFIVSDDEGMISRMAELIINPDLRAKMIDYNRKNLPSTNWTNVMEHHYKIYQRAIDLVRESTARDIAAMPSEETVSY